MTNAIFNKKIDEYNKLNEEERKLFIYFIDFIIEEIESNPAKIKKDNILFFRNEKKRLKLTNQRNQYEEELNKNKKHSEKNTYKALKIKIEAIDGILDVFDELDDDERLNEKLNMYNSFISIDKNHLRRNNINDKIIEKYIKILIQSNFINGLFPSAFLQSGLHSTIKDYYSESNEKLKEELATFKEFKTKQIFYERRNDLLTNKNLVGIDYEHKERWGYKWTNKINKEVDKSLDSILIKNQKNNIVNIKKLSNNLKKEEKIADYGKKPVMFNYEKSILKVGNKETKISGNTQKEIFNILRVLFMINNDAIRHKKIAEMLNQKHKEDKEDSIKEKNKITKKDVARIGSACGRLEKKVNEDFGERILKNQKGAVKLNENFHFIEFRKNI